MGQAEYQAACHIVRALKAAGHEAVLAGGCVRDRLLEITPKDYDVATSALPDEVKALFPGSKGVGEAFAVVLVRHDKVITEVATFRKDGPYADGRRPDYVEVGMATIEEDAARRDFTINGLFEDPDAPEESRVIDFHDGVADLLDRQCVRAIGDPAERIAEDRLRMLRAVRFAARFDFQIEANTHQAILNHAPELGAVSRERVGGEVVMMLAHHARAKAAAMLQNLGLDAAILGVSPPSSFPRLAKLSPQASEASALAAWAMDRGMPGEVAGVLREALRLSNEMEGAIRDALGLLPRLRTEWPASDVAAKKRMASHPGYQEAWWLLEATHPESAHTIAAEVAELSEGIGLAPVPLLSGDDLIAAGHRPGPHFAMALDAAYDAQLAGEISTLQEAKAIAERTFRRDMA